jgi:hypothetical protein
MAPAAFLQQGPTCNIDDGALPPSPLPDGPALPPAMPGRPRKGRSADETKLWLGVGLAGDCSGHAIAVDVMSARRSRRARAEARRHAQFVVCV